MIHFVLYLKISVVLKSFEQFWIFWYIFTNNWHCQGVQGEGVGQEVMQEQVEDEVEENFRWRCCGWKIYTNCGKKLILGLIRYSREWIEHRWSESTKHVNLPRIQISLIPTFLKLAWFALQNLSKEFTIHLKRCSDMAVKSK